MTTSIVAESAAVRTIPELAGQTWLPIPIAFQPLRDIVLAHRLDQPSMASNGCDEKRKLDGLLHVFEHDF